MAIFSLVMSQSIMLPIMIMMMVMFAIQMAATSIALEKEQKTLEILMTLPVSRMTILGGKLSGSIVIALAGAVSYLIGFGSYMNSAFSFVPEAQSMSLS
ncbi:ABC transporter permease subunit, partial [Candidatus Bathyarchaeota archaeon]|nr:ABC transporter permease subunit [Candidatus Bathyarchaeota archaeon]